MKKCDLSFAVRVLQEFVWTEIENSNELLSRRPRREVRKIDKRSSELDDSHRASQEWLAKYLQEYLK